MYTSLLTRENDLVGRCDVLFGSVGLSTTTDTFGWFSLQHEN
jgi:hypothetical protein